MAYEARDNTGTLFRNDRKEKDTHPNATGTAMIDGVEYYVSAWTKEGQKGKFQSLSFKRKDASQSRQRDDHRSNEPTGPYDDSEIPF